MGTTLRIVLLCLLIILVVEVHSQVVPYISFMGTSLPNNSYIDLTLVGAGSNSVQCHTDLTTCCSSAEGYDRGDWYFPNGTRLPFGANSIMMYEFRSYRQVQLRCRTVLPNFQGIYRCDIKTSAVRNENRETLYVGLYANGGDVIMHSMQFAVKTDFSEETFQFTLTCISTGGPATTVTWTRDSEEVSGGMTALNNTETAQYIHTLTVTGRLPGQYQCTVSNNKPSQNSASITVKAALAPASILAHQEGPHGIRVFWTPPTPLGYTTGYRIYYSGGGNNGSVSVLGGSTTNYLLTSLQNGVLYTVSIVGTSDHLPSYLVNYPNTITLIPGIPNVWKGLTTATTISLSWSVPSGSVVDNYDVMWQRDISGRCPQKDVGSTTIADGSTSCTIRGLEEDSNYVITVTATNAAGRVSSDALTGKTKEATPSAPPASVITSDVTSSSITVQWGAMDCLHQNGEITGYSVRYGVWRNSSTQSLNVSGGASSEIIISGLINATIYTVEVAAVNSAGIGQYSNPVAAVTGNKRKCRPYAGPGGVAGYAVGGFVVGVLITAVLGAVILVVVVRKMRTKLDAHITLPEVPKEQKHYIPTSTNAAYGCVEGARYTEHGIPSVAAAANQGPVYETVLN